MKVTFLGCGASAGVPHLIKGWGECDNKEHKNRRTRSSILVQESNINILIDASPDLRSQILSLPNVPVLDAVLITHNHFDHTAGLGELRTLLYNKDEKTCLYGNPETIEQLEASHRYLFYNDTDDLLYKPVLKSEKVTDRFCIQKNHQSLWVVPLLLDHAYMQSLGYRINDMAYVTDTKDIHENTKALLHNLDVLIIDCTSTKPKKAHAHLDLVLSWVEELKPKKTYLTHMDYTMDYHTLTKVLPKNVEPAFDGLEVLC